MTFILHILISFVFAANVDILKNIPVQDAGREKPFDDLAG